MASYKYVIACTDMKGGQHYPPDTPWKFSRFAHVIFSIHSLSINSCESRRELIKLLARNDMIINISWFSLPDSLLHFVLFL